MKHLFCFPWVNLLKARETAQQAAVQPQGVEIAKQVAMQGLTTVLMERHQIETAIKVGPKHNLRITSCKNYHYLHIG